MVNGSAFLGFLRLASVFTASLISCFGAPQPPGLVMGQLTNLRSSAEAVISNCFQKHSWITTDGKAHLLINVGSSSNALELYSGGHAVTWFHRATIPNSAKTSQGDGTLVGSRLYVVYSTRGRQIELTTFDYKPSASKWKMSGIIPITNDSQVAFDRPSIAVDNLQRVWIAASFVQNGTNAIALFLIEAQGAVPRQVGQFSTPNESSKRSARLLQTPDGVIMIYTDHPDSNSERFTLNFTYRLDFDAPDGPWAPPRTIFNFTNPEQSKNGGHFSAALDPRGNVHIATRSENTLIYVRLTNYDVALGTPKILGSAGVSPYGQVSVAESGNVSVIVPRKGAGIRQLDVLTSMDGGENFVLTHVLKLAIGKNTGQERIEAPSLYQDKLPVIQQVSLNPNRQLLAGFLVPMDRFRFPRSTEQLSIEFQSITERLGQDLHGLSQSDFLLQPRK
jgi:hypothetical protein